MVPLQSDSQPPSREQKRIGSVNLKKATVKPCILPSKVMQTCGKSFKFVQQEFLEFAEFGDARWKHKSSMQGGAALDITPAQCPRTVHARVKDKH